MRAPRGRPQSGADSPHGPCSRGPLPTPLRRRLQSLPQGRISHPSPEGTRLSQQDPFRDARYEKPSTTKSMLAPLRPREPVAARDRPSPSRLRRYADAAGRAALVDSRSGLLFAPLGSNISQLDRFGAGKATRTRPISCPRRATPESAQRIGPVVARRSRCQAISVCRNWPWKIKRTPALFPTSFPPGLWTRNPDRRKAWRTLLPAGPNVMVSRGPPRNFDFSAAVW
jgi:hypothetical protein